MEFKSGQNWNEFDLRFIYQIFKPIILGIQYCTFKITCLKYLSLLEKKLLKQAKNISSYKTNLNGSLKHF